MSAKILITLRANVHNIRKNMDISRNCGLEGSIQPGAIIGGLNVWFKKYNDVKSVRILISVLLHFAEEQTNRIPASPHVFKMLLQKFKISLHYLI